MTPLPIVLEFLEALVPTVVAAAGLRGVYEAAIGLRAKAKARRILSDNLAFRTEVRELADNPLKQVQPEMRDEIVRLLRDGNVAQPLSNREVQQIERGLNQASFNGEKRYIEDLVKPVAGT